MTGRSSAGDSSKAFWIAEITVVKRLFYYSVRLACRLVAVTVFQLRCDGRHHFKFDGGALILSTHQSHFDPVLIGLTFNERVHPLARRTLFHNWLLGLVIQLLDAIELDRERGGLAGLKETMRRLRSGKKVLIFPEGTRSPDGSMGTLKPGFISVARRCEVPLIPMVITGAFEALPRGARWPRRFPLRVTIGAPISAERVAELDDAQLLQAVSQSLAGCHRRARAQKPMIG